MDESEVMLEEAQAPITNGEIPTEPVEESAEELTSEAPSESEPTREVSRFEELTDIESSAAEYAEFCRLFPGVSLSSLPDEVAASVNAGVPLSAAYALYDRRRAVSAAAAETVNSKNRELSFAVKRNDTQDGYFSPDEVREMSAADVRANYGRIIESMSHWH